MDITFSDCLSLHAGKSHVQDVFHSVLIFNCFTHISVSVFFSIDFNLFLLGWSQEIIDRVVGGDKRFVNHLSEVQFWSFSFY